MKITIVRHGISRANLNNIYGKDDSPLVKEGISDLLRTKENLKGIIYDEVYVSPLKRAVESAEVLGLDDYFLDDRIKEMDFGIFKGFSVDYVRKNLSQYMNSWEKNKRGYIIPGGESRQLVYNRLRSFLEEKIAANKDILLVSHEGVIRLAFCWLLKSMDIYYNFQVDNASINQIIVNEGIDRISMVNCI